MCRNVKRLFNLEPSVTGTEIREASIQFVRKISGSTRPSRANEGVFDDAVEAIAAASRTLLDSLVTSEAPKKRAQKVKNER